MISYFFRFLNVGCSLLNIILSTLIVSLLINNKFSEADEAAKDKNRIYVFTRNVNMVNISFY